MKRYIIAVLLILFTAIPSHAIFFIRGFTSVADVEGGIANLNCSDVHTSVYLASGGSSTDDGIGILSTLAGDGSFYYFDESATDATDSPDKIRCKNYSTSGVWLRRTPEEFGTAAALDAEETMTDGVNLPDGGAIKAYGDTYWNKRFFEGETVTALTPDDPSPEVEPNKLYDTTGATTEPVIDFVDSDGDHSDFADGDHFGVIVNDDDFTIEFDENANIEGNANTDFTGSASEIVLLLFVYEGSGWICVNFNMGFSNPTTFAVSSIETPTLESDQLNDQSDPHLLIAAELKNKYLSNINSSGADEWDFPARGEGWGFCFIKEADQDITLDPYSGENWYFRTDNSAYVLNGVNYKIINTTAGKSTLCCISTETSVFCTGDANWEQGGT